MPSAGAGMKAVWIMAAFFENRCRLLHLAYERFSENEEYRRFVSDNADWLEDYALFIRLMDHSYQGLP